VLSALLKEEGGAEKRKGGKDDHRRDLFPQTIVFRLTPSKSACTVNAAISEPTRGERGREGGEVQVDKRKEIRGRSNTNVAASGGERLRK